jgi:hypothetical protein
MLEPDIQGRKPMAPKTPKKAPRKKGRSLEQGFQDREKGRTYVLRRAIQQNVPTATVVLANDW